MEQRGREDGGRARVVAAATGVVLDGVAPISVLLGGGRRLQPLVKEDTPSAVLAFGVRSCVSASRAALGRCCSALLARIAIAIASLTVGPPGSSTSKACFSIVSVTMSRSSLGSDLV